MARIKVGAVAENLPMAPQVNAPAAAFGASGNALQVAAKDLTTVAGQMAQAEEKIRTKRETLEQLRLAGELERELTDTWTKWESDRDENGRPIRDITDPTTVAEFGKTSRETIAKYLDRFSGSDLGRSTLEIELEQRAARVGQTAAKSSLQATEKLIEQTVGDVVGQLAFQAGANPTSVPDLFKNLDAHLTRLSPAISQTQREAMERSGRSQIFRSAIESFIDRGDIRTARDILEETPAAGRFLTPEDQRSLRRSIADKQRAALNEPMEVVEQNGQRFYVPRSQAAGMPAPMNRPVLTPEEQGRAKFLETLSAADAKKVSEVFDAADTAARTRSEISRMTAAIDSGRFTTGVFSDARQFLSRLAEFTGTNENETVRRLLGDAATADTLDAAAKQLGIAMADKMGRVTNMSLQFVVDALPSLSRTPEGNKIILEVMDRTSRREIEIANLTEQYLQANGGNPRPPGKRSLFQTIRDLEEKSPVVDEDLRRRITEGSKAAPSSFKDVIKDISGTAPAIKGPGSSQQNPARPTTMDEAAKLPTGAFYVNPADGKVYRKR